MQNALLSEPQVIRLSEQLIEQDAIIRKLESERSEIKKKTQDEIFNALTSTLGDLSKTKSEQILAFDIVNMTRKRINDCFNK